MSVTHVLIGEDEPLAVRQVRGPRTGRPRRGQTRFRFG